MKKKNALYVTLAGAMFAGVSLILSGATSVSSDFSFSSEPLAKTVIKTATEEDRAQRAATWAADALFSFLVPEGE